MKKIVLGILVIIIIILSVIGINFFTKERYITSDVAKQIAMDDVSNKDGEYKFNSIEFKETTNNMYIYTLEFSDKVNYYTYKINAKTKKIISSKKEMINNNKIYMEEDEILKIVFKNAKLNKEECNLISNLITIEGETPVYNTMFYYNNVKHVYKTNALTGSIISVAKLDENAV